MQRLILTIILGYLLRRTLKSADTNITQLSYRKRQNVCYTCRKSLSTTFIKQDECMFCHSPIEVKNDKSTRTKSSS